MVYARALGWNAPTTPSGSIQAIIISNNILLLLWQKLLSLLVLCEEFTIGAGDKVNWLFLDITVKVVLQHHNERDLNFGRCNIPNLGSGKIFYNPKYCYIWNKANTYRYHQYFEYYRCFHNNDLAKVVTNIEHKNMIATVIILATNTGLIRPLTSQSSPVYHRHGLQQQPIILQMYN